MAEETLDPEHQTQGDTKEGTAVTHLFTSLEQSACKCYSLHVQSSSCTSILFRILSPAVWCFPWCKQKPGRLDLLLCAGLYFGREVPLDCEEAKLPLHGPNQWPSEVVTQILKKF